MSGSGGFIGQCAAVVLASALAILVLNACSQPRHVAESVSDSSTESVRSAELFRQKCAVCHGGNGEGQPDWQIRKPDGLLPAPPLNGDGHTWHHGDGTLYRIVSQGGAIYESPGLPKYKSGMPAFGEHLSQDEIIAVINYLKTLWGNKVAEGLGLPIRESQAIVSETDPFPQPAN